VSFADGVLEAGGQTLLRDVTERPRGERGNHHVLLLVNREENQRRCVRVTALVRAASMALRTSRLM
jgi:hypothetical protein